MVDLVAVLAVGFLLVGVVGAIVPGVPGPLASLAGVYLYWWHSGFADPGIVLLLALTAIGVLALVADYASGVVSARVGGASFRTTLVAGAVGLALLFVAGPVGTILGVVATVFVLEVRRHRDPARGARTAAVVVLGMLGSAVVQVLLTTTMLVAFVAGVVL